MMQLAILPGRFAVCRLSPTQNVPEWVWRDRTLLSVTYTAEELSIVCVSDSVPNNVQCEHGWAAIKVRGPLDFALTGVLASLATPLAEAGIALFALSTFDTDYLLLKEDMLHRAKVALEHRGHIFEA